METEDQRELRRIVRTIFDRADPVRPAPGEEAGHDEATWKLLSEQVGVCGLAVPEEHGGAGFGMAESLIVSEEVGRAAAPLPHLGSAVLATLALERCGATDLLSDLVSGAAVAALAWAEDGAWDADAVRAAETGGKITGVKEHALDAARADFLIVPARTGGSLGLFVVDPGPGVRVESLPTMDQTRPQGRVVLEDAPARPLTRDGRHILDHLLDVAASALAAEQLGGAQRCLDMTIEYVKTREQFGRPIGSFQAVKHRLADLYVLVESSRSAVRATSSVDPVSASVAKAFCSDAYFTVAGETIQLHGGIGFTWEHEAHIHFKRAHSGRQLFGTPDWHRRRLAAHAL